MKASYRTTIVLCLLLASLVLIQVAVAPKIITPVTPDKPAVNITEALAEEVIPIEETTEESIPGFLSLRGTTWEIYDFHDGLTTPQPNGCVWQFSDGYNVQDPSYWSGTWQYVSSDKIEIIASPLDGSTDIVLDVVFIRPDYFIELTDNTITHIGVRQ